MRLCFRHSRLPAHAYALAGKASRERIIPAPYAVQTPQWNATAVTVRGSLLVVAVFLPLLASRSFFDPQVLPALALLLTASHGSCLVHRRISRT
ncbi:hypothetical protein YW3DRAFT_06493 [Streptomyces sp. MnatMP-M77]|uniref:hypothetical protein n=1 Tax=unclassified Streptomyces TaxID=2593676 RepID=UPI0008057A7C|nr:hypothetical protein [Streptomyces sp. MnatMP-M77]SBU99243.1 hypothetical protein YW3DRAFT_06493 [Streptomyces sp. MnatMP-M77]